MRGWTATGFELDEDDEAALQRVPQHLQGGIRRYVCDGIPPGSFLEAVISNDLFEAVARADEKSLAGLLGICRFFYNHTDGNCYGSEEKLSWWVNRHRVLREAGGGDPGCVRLFDPECALCQQGICTGPNGSHGGIAGP